MSHYTLRAAVAAVVGIGGNALAELVPLDDAALGEIAGRDGIIIDLNLGADIGQISYTNESFSNGSSIGEASLNFNDVVIGQVDPTTGERTGSASVDGITIDVVNDFQFDGDSDPRAALQIGLPTIDALDIYIDSITLGETGDLGGLFIDDFSSLAPDSAFSFLNDRFGTNITGLGSGTTNLAGQFNIAGTLPTDDNADEGGFLVSSTFGGRVEGLFYRQGDDDGINTNQIGLSGVTFFGLGDNGDGTQSVGLFDLGTTHIFVQNANQFDGGTGGNTLLINSEGVRGSLAVEDILLGEDSVGSLFIRNLVIQDLGIGISSSLVSPDLSALNPSFDHQGLTININSALLSIDEIAYQQASGGTISIRDVVLDRGIDGVAALLGVDQEFLDNNVGLGLVDDFGRPFNASTLRLGAIDYLASTGVDTEALQVTLPELTRIRNAFLTNASNFAVDAFGPALSSINFRLQGELFTGDNSLGRVTIRDFIDLDTRLNIFSNNTAVGNGGLAIDLELGLGFGEIVYTDTDEDGGSITFDNVRIGQFFEDESLGERIFSNSDAREQVTRYVLGAPINNLTFDLDRRNIVDLTDGVSRERTAIVVGLPEIQNLDVVVDDIRIGDGSIGGFEIHNINTFISNDDVAFLNTHLGENFALGTQSGVDTAGNTITNGGYQFAGTENVISANSEGGFQADLNFGGSIGSIEYHDDGGSIALEGVTVYSSNVDSEGNNTLGAFNLQTTVNITADNAIEFGNINSRGSIAIQNISIGNGSLGALAIQNFQLNNSRVTISGK